MKYCLYILASVSLFACGTSRQLSNGTAGIEVSKIWDTAPHSAFPDIVRFKGAFYCSFREGTGHVPGTDGKARVIKSVDGENWESVALLEKQDIDLRDPKISITPDNRLMLILGGSVYGKEERSKLLNLYPHVSFSDASGANFSTPEKVSIEPAASGRDWIWRVTWHKGVGYAINYNKNGAELLKTNDGKRYEKVSALNIDGYPNESTVRFDNNDNIFVLVRREEGDKMGVLAESAPPYTAWNYKKLDIRLGGPNSIFYKKNNIIIGSRLYAPGGASTAVFLADKNGAIKKTIKLPSGGDTSYPGLLVYENKLWVVYYSSHETKTSIYLAKIPLSELGL